MKKYCVEEAEETSRSGTFGIVKGIPSKVLAIASQYME
jgi:hypothetical protein